VLLHCPVEKIYSCFMIYITRVYEPQLSYWMSMQQFCCN